MFAGIEKSEARIFLFFLVFIPAGLFVASLRNPAPAPVITGPAIHQETVLATPAVSAKHKLSPTPPPALRAIDINTSTAEEFELLPGVGPAKAGDIVAEREANGPFASVEALARVKGIGPKTIESLRPHLTVSHDAPVATRRAEPTPVPQPSPKAEPPSTPAPTPSPTPLARIAINSASAEQLDELKGVGPVLAQRILAYRAANGPFRSMRDLEHVKGIGPRVAADMANQVSFD